MIRPILVVMAAMTMLGTQAEATVYTFMPTLTGAVSPYFTPDTLSFTIAVDDATVRSGSFSYHAGYSFSSSSNSYVFTATGDVQEFQYFRNNARGIALFSNKSFSGFYEDYFDAKLNFNSLGQVVTGSVEYSTDSYYLFISGKDQVFTGISGTGFLPPAYVTGPLTGLSPSSIPEPTTLGLLGATLAFLGARQRRIG